MIRYVAGPELVFDGIGEQQAEKYCVEVGGVYLQGV